MVAILARLEFVKELSDREMQVLLLLADGMDQREIALELDLGYNTVASHALNIREKLNAKTTTHAIALAFHLGILIPRVK